MANSIDLIFAQKATESIDAVTAKLKLADAELLKVSKSALEASKNLSKITTPSSLDNSVTTTKALNDKLKEQEKAIKSLTTQLTRLTSARTQGNTRTAEEIVNQRALTTEANRQARANSTLVGAYAQLSAQQAIASKRYQDLIVRGKLAAQTQDQYNRELAEARNEFQTLNTRVLAADAAVGRFNRNVGNYPQQAVQGIKSLIQAFGVVGGVMLFANVVKDAFDRIREFDKSMQNLAGVFRTTREELKPLEADIIKIAGSSIKTSNEIAQLAETLATLGKSKEQIQKLLKPVNDLSIGLESSGADAGEFLIQMLNVFGASEDEAQKYADTIASIRTSTSLDFTKMKDSFQYIAPIAKLLNKDLAYTGSVVGILADNGLKAESSGRLLATSIQRLAKNGLSLEDALLKINIAQEKGVKGQQLLSMASKLLGAEGAKVGIVLANNTNIIEKNAQAIRDNGGALDDLVNQQLESVDAKIKILDSTYESFILGIEKGDGVLSGAFKGFLQGITNGLAMLTRLNSSWDELYEKAKSNGADLGVKEYDERYKKIRAITLGDKEAHILILKKAQEEEAILLKQRANTIKEINDFNPYALNVGKSKKSLREEREQIELDLAARRELIFLSAKKIKAINTEENKSNNVLSGQAFEEGKKLSKEQQKALEDSLKTRYDLQKKEIELQLAYIDKTLDNDSLYFSDRLKALDDDFLKRNELVKINYDEELRQAEGSQEKQRIAFINFQISKLDLIEKYNKKEKELNKGKLGSIDTLVNKADDPNKQLLENAKVAIKELEKVGEKLEENEEKAKKAKEATEAYLSSFISEFASKSGFGETLNMFTDEFDFMEKTAEEKTVAIMESFQEMYNFISNASQANFDAEKSRLQDQYDLSVGYAGDNAAAKEKLADDLEKKQNDISNREAKQKKKQAIFNIAIDTAQAVIATLAKTPLPAGAPLAIAVGLIGAVQLAAVSAQQIPAYEGGTDNHIGGWMKVNDRKGSNYEEKVILPGGKVIKPKGRNVLMDAPAGTRVLNHEQQIHEMLNDRGISMNNAVNYSGATAGEIDTIMAKHFSNIQTNVTNIDKNGISSYYEKNGNRTKQHASRVSRTGFKI